MVIWGHGLLSAADSLISLLLVVLGNFGAMCNLASRFKSKKYETIVNGDGCSQRRSYTSLVRK